MQQCRPRDLKPRRHGAKENSTERQLIGDHRFEAARVRRNGGGGIRDLNRDGQGLSSALGGNSGAKGNAATFTGTDCLDGQVASPVPVTHVKAISQESIPTGHVAVEQYTAESSRTTHGAQECIDACRLFGRIICRALLGGPKTVAIPISSQTSRRLEPSRHLFLLSAHCL